MSFVHEVAFAARQVGIFVFTTMRPSFVSCSKLRTSRSFEGLLLLKYFDSRLYSASVPATRWQAAFLTEF
jgi:hypothetical protein